MFRFLLLVLIGLFFIQSVVRADLVQLLHSEERAYQSRLSLIDSATTTVDLAYYSVQDDASSHKVLERLRAAARRGVAVRIVVDALFNGIPRGMQRHLTAEGIQIREYHRPDCFEPDSLLARMHDKMLIVDRCSVILGGRNISDDYFRSSSRKHYIDLDVEISGSAARHAAVYFDCVWNSRHARPASEFSVRPAIVVSDLAGSLQSVLTNSAHFRADSAAELLNGCQPNLSCGANELRPEEPWNPVLVPCHCVEFLHSGRPANRRADVVSERIASVISGAQRRVVIESPYFVLWDRMERAFQEARQRGVCVQILTNSIDSTDNLIVNAELTNQKHRLRSLGVELFEFHGHGVLHAKSVVVDDTALIGSFNFNPRSEYYDTETVVVVHSREVAEQLLWSVSLRHQYSYAAVPHKSICDFLLPPEKAAPPKYFSVQLMRMFTPLIRRHL